jgi:hypothetical protein
MANQTKIIRRRYEFDPRTRRYFVTEFYRDGSSSGKRDASPNEKREYQASMFGETTVGRLCEGIHDIEEGRFEDSD